MVVALALWVPGVARGQVLSPLERGVLNEIDLLRANPAAYAGVLRQWRPDVHDGGESVRALDEAIGELQSMRGGLSRLSLSSGLSRAARDQVRDTGSRGLVGHTGSDGSTFRKRIERYGVWSGSIAENIVYGPDMAREAVIQMVVDAGVEGRGHRRTLLNPAWHYVGIACGRHAVYGTMCVMDFAASYRDGY